MDAINLRSKPLLANWLIDAWKGKDQMTVVRMAIEAIVHQTLRHRIWQEPPSDIEQIRYRNEIAIANAWLKANLPPECLEYYECLVQHYRKLSRSGDSQYKGYCNNLPLSLSEETIEYLTAVKRGDGHTHSSQTFSSYLAKMRK
jgi:hypothetical protein